MNLAQAWNRLQNDDPPHEAMRQWPKIAAAMVIAPPPSSANHGGLSISNLIRAALQKENGLSCHQLADRTGRGYESVKCVLRRYMKDIEPRKTPEGKVTYYLVKGPSCQISQ